MTFSTVNFTLLRLFPSRNYSPWESKRNFHVMMKKLMNELTKSVNGSLLCMKYAFSIWNRPFEEDNRQDYPWSEKRAPQPSNDDFRIHGLMISIKKFIQPGINIYLIICNNDASSFSMNNLPNFPSQNSFKPAFFISIQQLNFSWFKDMTLIFKKGPMHWV